MMIKRTTLITLAVATFATAAPAHAQSGNAYGGQGNVIGQVTQGTNQGGNPAGGEGNVLGQVTQGTAGNTRGPGQGTSGTPRQENEAAVAPNAVNQVAATSGSGLPFTGFDVLLLVVGGIALVGVGAGLRRLTTPAP